jgi:signal transduction histidine kinase
MFNSARFKLTAWYLLIIMVISISFSAVIFRASSSEVERFDRIQRSRIVIRFGFPTVPIQDPSLVLETERRIIGSLVLINIGILAVSGITGYFLAGITLAPIKEMIDEQNRFISDASHEIGTPLTSLKTAFEVFLREKKPNLEEAKVLVKESVDEVNKLQALSTSLLQLAQSEIPNGDKKFEVVSIKDIAKESIKQVNPIAKQKGIIINEKIENGKLKGNKYSLIDLVVILLENAIKYSPENSKIEIISKTHKDHIKITVTDKGIGIPKIDQPHIFDRFYRADLARSKKLSEKKVGGYGLGLSIAKKIVDNHKGTISVKSELEKGSTFIIVLPK